MPSNLQKTKLFTPRNRVPYALTKGPEVNAVCDGPLSATASYQIFSIDLQNFIDELMPPPQNINGDNGPITIKLPTMKLGPVNGQLLSPVSAKIYPFQSDLPIDYFSQDTRLDSYNEYAAVDVQYQTNIDALYNTIRTNQQPVTFLEPQFSVTVEILGIHPNKNTQSGDLAPGSQNPTNVKPITDITAPIPKVIPIVERSFRWSWALNPDFKTIFTLLGKVNGTQQLPWIPEAQTETVMFLGLEGKLQWNWSMLPLKVITPWDMQYKFAQRQVNEAGKIYGWNHFYDPGLQQWKVVFRQGGSTRLYDNDDFNKLFKVLPPNG